MKAVILIICSICGGILVLRGFLKNLKEIKARSNHSATDKFINYPLMVVWYGYLLVFCGGLVVNNLIID